MAPEATTKAINSELLIFNPDASKTITVVATYVAVPLNATNGVDAWFSYFAGTTMPSVSIGPGQFKGIFVQNNLAANAIFGVVADLVVVDAQNNPATADLYDLAWIKNSGGATKQAQKDGTHRVRGLAAVPPNNYGYWIPVNLNPLSINSIITPPGSPQGVTIAAAPPPYALTNDAFNGADAPLITDPDGSQAPLVGDYGAQLCFTWPVANDDPKGVLHTITFYAGNFNTDRTNFVIYYNGPGGCTNPGSGELALNHYLPFIQDTVPKNTTVTYRFQIVTIGGYSTPLTVWMEVTT